jgi:hypothetical protein
VLDRVYISKTQPKAQHGDYRHRAAGEFIIYCQKCHKNSINFISSYKTQSLRSDSVTPSPTGGYGSDNTPELSNAQSPDTTRGVVWAVTDLASVPKGSLIIDPQTLQPILNQDG